MALVYLSAYILGVLIRFLVDSIRKRNEYQRNN